MMKYQRNRMAFTRRSFRAAVISGTARRAVAMAITIAIAFQLVPSANAEPSNSANVNTTPRKILTGWIPYYGMSTSLPTAVANADLIN
jgi:hypothetical protein